MKYNTLKWWAPRTQVSFFALGIFLVGIWSLTFYASHMQREDMKRVLGEQEFSTASLVANDINTELDNRLKVLEKVATLITPAILGNAASTQKFLEDQPTLLMLFSAGNLIYGIDGTAIADVPLSEKRIGINYADRDFMIEALKGKSTIGKPVMGKKMQVPVFVMATPIRNTDGKVIGALSGVTSLGVPNFISKIIDNSYGKTGGYLLTAPQHKLFVAATDKSRIMTPLPAPGINPLFDRYMQGFEGYGVAKNSLGIKELTASKKIPTAGWFIIAKIPTAEAFAPIRAMQQRLILAALILTLLAVGLTRWLIKFQQANELLEQREMEREEMLRRSEQRFRSFVENANDLVYTLSQTGIITYLAPNVESLLGYLPSELIGTSFTPLIHEDELPSCIKFLQKVFETGTNQSGLEYRIRHKNGNWLWFVSNASLVTDTTTGDSDFLGIGHDITQRKLAEYRLHETTAELEAQTGELQMLNESLEHRVHERTVELMERESRFEQLANQSRTVVWEVDAQGLYTYISDMSETIYGFRPEEVVGRKYFYDMLPESERETIMEAAFSVFREKENFEAFEHSSILANDNRHIWVSTNGIPILSKNGTLLGYRGSDTDITERKKLEGQLIQSQKMEAVGQLAGGLAHDFNNVLSIINGYGTLLQIEMEQDDTLKEYLGKMLSASSRAGELTHSMLAFSRTQVMNPENQNLNGIVSKTGTFVEKIIGEHIQFKTVINETTLPVYVDGGQIEQILINLANNARDAMPNGGKLTITTDCVNMDANFITAHGFGTPERYALITVSDTGTGIDEATRKKLFEPFFTTKTVDKGTGLGLAMVYGITKQHKGFVDVSSQPGHGASFRVYLPIVETEAAKSEVKTATGIETSAGNETILVAEDNADLREFMSKILKRLGYQVILAVDGQDAVDKFRDNADSIRLIIMDMIMPNKSGKVAYDEIKMIRPDAMALFSSGYSAKIVQQQGELGKNAEFISKPVQPAELMKKVREMLDR